MAIYTWRCAKCGDIEETVQSIGEYSNPDTKRIPAHCDQPMDRMLTVHGGMAAICNALAGDRHYDGLVATDGTLINSRSKHREYMKRNGLTIADDYKGEWAKAERERRERFDPNVPNTYSRAIIEREFTKREQR